MRIFKFALVLLITVIFIYLADTTGPFGTTIPALGPFFSPFHGFWKNAEKVNSYKDETFHFDGLNGPAQVVLDERMVPHIFAANENDAFFVQGYMHARHRFFQMDIATRSAAGRVSELVGPRAVNYDKTQRRKGLGWAAENALAAFQKSESDRNAIVSYTRGVNAYLESLSPEQYPLEYKILGIAPEPWTEMKCALFFKSFANTLCFGHNDLKSTNARAFWGDSLFAELYPEYNPKQSPVIPEGTTWDFDALAVDQYSSEEVPIGMLPYESMPMAPPYIGSNNWAVAGSKTASGNPILCNDPHLDLTLPSIWYEIQIHTPEMNAYGVSAPGVPGILIGFNENIAWGQTNVGWDVLDWYTIEWADEERTSYVLDGETKEVNYRLEEIYVKGQKEPVIDTVKYTVWGPVSYENKDSEYAGMAMRWIAHDRPNGKDFYEMGTFIRLMKGRNYEDYRQALYGFDAPAQNFAYASKEGDIAITVNGKFPVRRNQQGRFIQDGSTSDNAWKAFIPKDQVPSVKNPERGFISSANQRSTDASYPYYYLGRNFDDYRGRYVNRRLEAMENITPQDMMKLQNDNFSIFPEDGLPPLLALLEGAELTEDEKALVQLLKEWDYRFDPDAVAPALFLSWQEKMYERTMDEIGEQDKKTDMEYVQDWRFFELLQQNPDHLIFDVQETEERETAGDLAVLTFKEACKEYRNIPEEERIWSRVKSTFIPHIASIPGMASNTLYNGGYDDALNSVKKSNGPSWRMIVEMGDRPIAYGVFPGGPSGNPGSPFYDNTIQQWAEGKYYALHLYESAEAAENPLFTISFDKP